MGIKKGLILLVIAWLTNTLVCFHGVDLFEKNEAFSPQSIGCRQAPRNLLSWLARLQHPKADKGDATKNKVKYRFRYLNSEIQQLYIFWKKTEGCSGAIARILIEQSKPAFHKTTAPVKFVALQLFRLTPF